MPSSSEILATLFAIASDAVGGAIAWQVGVTTALVAIVLGLIAGGAGLGLVAHRRPIGHLPAVHAPH